MQAHNIQRNLEQSGLYINRFWSGVNTNRSPIFAPLSQMGLQVLKRLDTLWDGLNAEISPKMTLTRRYGFSKYCSTAFGSSDYPLAFYSFKNLSGTIYNLVDTPTHVYKYTTSAITSVFSKSTSAQTSFQKVANIVYGCDGTSSWKWDGTTRTNMGIVAPSVAPTLSYVSGSLSPTSGYQYVYVYRNSSTGTTSSASPASANTGQQTSKNISVGYTASADSQVDKIDIYRTADGGGVYYFLVTVNNGTSTYTDSTADSGLNTDQLAPVAGVNAPPPSGISLLVWHMGRLWAAAGNVLYFSAGPDCTNGVGAEAWPASNNLPVAGNITALVSTSQGLVVFTSDNAYVVGGTDSSSFTTPQIWQKNFGVANQNCVTQDGDLLFVFTTKGQLFTFSGTLTEIGFPIASSLAAMTPANVYLAIHRNGTDEGLFVSDGSTNLWRFSMNNSCWSPVFQPVSGLKAIGSVETSTNNWTLQVGRSSGSGYILKRDTTVFTDDGSAYSSYATIGSLVLAPPRQVAVLNSVLIEASATGTYPTVSVLLNEISGSFTALPNPVADPPQLAASSTLWMKRHDLKAAASPLPQHVRHLQVKIDFGNTDTVQNELLGLGLV